MADKFRILTINTHKGLSTFARRSLLPKLKNAIEYSSADLVFLQEVHGEHKKLSKSQNWSKNSQYEYLADSLWPDFAYGKNAIYPDGHHGNAILSKYPIKSSENIDISPHKLERRGFLHCKIGLPKSKKIIHCICVHLSLFQFQRASQFKTLCQYVAENVPENDPLIVAGDFNDWTLRANHKLEKIKGLEETYQVMEGGHARTFPSYLPLLKLDRIYVRGLKINRSEVLFSGVFKTISDHAALSADVELNHYAG